MTRHADRTGLHYLARQPIPGGRAFLTADRGRLTLLAWVDHVGSAGTRHVTGDLVRDWPLDRAPDCQKMSKIVQPELI